MEVAPFDVVEDDSTLSWAQLTGCCLCFLCCYGAVTAMFQCGRIVWARCETRRQDWAPKMKEQGENRNSVNPQIPPLVRDQGAQTDRGDLCCWLLPKNAFGHPQ